MQNAHRQIVREQMVNEKKRSAEHNNRSARDLPPLHVQREVYVEIDLN